ncbi:hypothetical protein V6N13_065271 [Hibiscus sabdariffa]|uniref:Uncharacterized protein n=1 Tax=Hibiscus sabdariffa TaxID=183260 RepID=A0ABR2QRS4_9ROSI
MESNPWRVLRITNSSSSSLMDYTTDWIDIEKDLILGGGYGEVDRDEGFLAKLLCPFCADDFDIVGFCCHMDEEHPIEVKNGVCPVCAKWVGREIVSHITMQHGNFLKVQRKRRLRKVGSNSTSSMLRNELREGNLHAVLVGSSRIVSPSNVEADPVLSSFMFNPPTADEPLSLQSLSIAESSAEKESADKEILERKPQQLQLSDKEHEEKARRCEFIRGLLISTILYENF